MFERKRFIAKQDRIPKQNPYLPPFLSDMGMGILAKCPKCQKITSIRTCYGCKELMCEECLLEHQVKCLRVKNV